MSEPKGILAMPEPDTLTRLRRIRDRRQHGLPPECMADVDFLLGQLVSVSRITKAVLEDDADRWRNMLAFISEMIEAATLQPIRKRCPKCGGEQEVDGETCSECEGSGYQEPKA